MTAAIAHPIVPQLVPQAPHPFIKSSAARILFISAHPSTTSCAATLAESLQLDVELACNRRSGLAALRRGEYTLILVDEDLVTIDPGGCDLLWQNAGLALPLEVNLTHSSFHRILRDVRAALSRRHREHTLARRAAAQRLESELKSSLAGLLLQSELALREPSVPAKLLPRLRQVVSLAADLRKHLTPSL